tara:strand:+ start:159 stop:572 length:414 start_codon:yes stop_codon:yes gene_type:complete
MSESISELIAESNDYLNSYTNSGSPDSNGKYCMFFDSLQKRTKFIDIYRELRSALGDLDEKHQKLATENNALRDLIKKAIDNDNKELDEEDKEELKRLGVVHMDAGAKTRRKPLSKRHRKPTKQSPTRKRARKPTHY